MEERSVVEISRPMGERIENGALRYDPVFHPPMCVMSSMWYECEGCGVCGEEREAGAGIGTERL
jgi:hypothetical protein